MFTKLFWKATVERVIRTFAQALVALIGVNAVVTGFDIVHFACGYSLSVSGGAGFLALLTCIIAGIKNDDESPAFNSAE